MAEAAKGLDINLYPNPSQGKFQLQLSGLTTSTAELTVTDLAGKTLLTKEVKTSEGMVKETIDLKTAKGIYLLQVKTVEQTIIRKVIVE
jgi:hypothetical protein